MYAASYASEHPEQPVFVMGGTGAVVTYAGYEAAANRIAHLYRAGGLRRADHVAFLMENSVRMLEAEGGAERSGLYYTCVNSYLSVEEAAYIVDDCEARVFVTSAEKLDVAAHLPALCPRVERWLVADLPRDASPPDGYERFEDA